MKSFYGHNATLPAENVLISRISAHSAHYILIRLLKIKIFALMMFLLECFLIEKVPDMNFAMFPAHLVLDQASTVFGAQQVIIRLLVIIPNVSIHLLLDGFLIIFPIMHLAMFPATVVLILLPNVWLALRITSY